jgi:hypothetical protein
LPEPLVPAEINLRDFQYMELDVGKLRDSRFSAQVSGDAFRAGVLLWCAAWHQVPAGSLPDDDIELANLAGYGRFWKEWKKVREEALQGFVKCRDGRLYHKVVCEKAAAAWNSKLRHHYDRACDRLRKVNKKRSTEGQPLVTELTFEQWNAQRTSAGIPMERADASAGIPQNAPPESAGIPAENALKGNGEGEGEGNKPPVPPDATGTGAVESDPPEAAGAAPTPAGIICRKLRAAGIARTNPGHPKLAELIAVGATADELAGYAEQAKSKGDPFTWLLTAAMNERKQAAQQAQGMKAGPLKAAAASGNPWEGAH